MILFKVMVVVMTALVLNGCSPREAPRHVDEQWLLMQQTLLPRQVGVFLILTALDPAYASISNNLGMSGREGRNHWHNNLPEQMFAGARQDFIFDIGRIEQLGELHIWNYNAPGNTGNGIRNVTISLSEDNINYVEFGTFELKEADGSARLLATNLTDGSFIDFGARTARFIKFSPIDNHGGALYGLSQIRLFRFMHDVFRGGYISASPIERFDNDGVWIPSPESYNLTNGVGLSQPFSATATHNNNPNHMFHTRRGVLGFPIDLRGRYPVERIVIWNYNAPGNTNFGLRRIRISVSEDGVRWTATPGTFELPQGTGEDGLPPSLVIETNLWTRYIRIDNLENWGGEFSGLSAVRTFIGEGWFVDYAPDWTAMFSNFYGWGGADGVYMVNLDGRDYDPNRDPQDKRTFVIFSDTICGRIDPVTDIRSIVYMPNNTAAIIDGGKPDTTRIRFFYPEQGGATALITPYPLQPVTHGRGYKYYWMGAPFVIGSHLYIFGLLIDSVEPVRGFGFEQVGVDLVRFDIVDGDVDFSSLVRFNDTTGRLCDIRYGERGDRWYFGGAVFKNTVEAGALDPDGYIYIFGYFDQFNGRRMLVAARVLPQYIEDFYKWEYLQADGTWGDTMYNPMFLAADIAPEISVHQVRHGPYKGQFFLVFTQMTVGNEIRLFVSPSLTTPFTNFTTSFSNQRSIFWHDTTNSVLGRGNNSYNAKAHPAISNARELFISYHINGEDCFRYGDIYRPRFLRFAKVPVLPQR